MDRETLFAGVDRVMGLRGCAVFDPFGRCVAEQLVPPLTLPMLARLVTGVRGATDVFESAGSTVAQVALVATGGQVVAVRVGPLLLLAVAGAQTNLGMLGVALNVVAAKLRHEPIAIAPPPAPPVAAPVVQAPPRVEPPRPRIVARGAIKQLLTAFQLRVGPVAKLSLQNAFNTLGVSLTTLTWERYPELVHELASLIPTDRRQAFLDEARRIPLDAE